MHPTKKRDGKNKKKNQGKKVTGFLSETKCVVLKTKQNIQMNHVIKTEFA